MEKILLVVDYQNDFVNGALGFAGAEKLDKGIAEKIRSYGAGRVFYTQDTHHEDYLTTREGRHLPVPHCIEGSFGWEIYGETAKALREVQAVGFCKESFGMNPYCDRLPEQVDQVELVGLVSNICVLSNAVTLQTRYPQAQIVVDASLTDSFNPKLHQAVLDVLEGIQVNVLHRDGC